MQHICLSFPVSERITTRVLLIIDIIWYNQRSGVYTMILFTPSSFKWKCASWNWAAPGGASGQKHDSHGMFVYTAFPPAGFLQSLAAWSIELSWEKYASQKNNVQVNQFFFATTGLHNTPNWPCISQPDSIPCHGVEVWRHVILACVPLAPLAANRVHCHLDWQSDAKWMFIIWNICTSSVLSVTLFIMCVSWKTRRVSYSSFFM